MTDAKPPALFDWATELSDAQGHVTLSEQEAHEIGARLRSMGAENETLQAGYAAARLEIESLRARSVEPSGEYPALPEPDRVMEDWSIGGVLVDYFTTDQMRAFADADRAMRASQTAGAQQAPAQAAQEPVAWYVTGGSRLLDEDEAKAEARHIGGTARAIPLYTAPQADSVTAPAGGAAVPADWPTDAMLEAGRKVAATHGRLLGSGQSLWHVFREMFAAAPTPPAQAADSVLEDAGGANWQDISTAPKDGTRFVAVGNNYGLYSETQHTCIAQWFRGCWMEVSDWNEASELKYLTHWMPLPPLPGSAARAPADSVHPSQNIATTEVFVRQCCRYFDCFHLPKKSMMACAWSCVL